MGKHKNITPIQLGFKISNFVECCGSQKKAAELLGISPQYLSDILIGRRDISAKVARMFGYEPVKHFRKLDVC